MKLQRFWIKFEPTDKRSWVSLLGFGVTALGQEDALYLLKTRVFDGQEMPPVKEIIEDVDVSKLDPKHILPNMKGNPAARGVWFPHGFDREFKR